MPANVTYERYEILDSYSNLAFAAGVGVLISTCIFTHPIIHIYNAVANPLAGPILKSVFPAIYTQARLYVGMNAAIGMGTILLTPENICHFDSARTVDKAAKFVLTYLFSMGGSLALFCHWNSVVVPLSPLFMGTAFAILAYLIARRIREINSPVL